MGCSDGNRRLLGRLLLGHCKSQRQHGTPERSRHKNSGLLLLCRGAFRTEARKALLNRLPEVLQEREFPTWEWKDYNKAFVCVRSTPPLPAGGCHVPVLIQSSILCHMDCPPVQEWLDSEHVVVGTKCNRLLCLNTATGKVRPAARQHTHSSTVPGRSCGRLQDRYKAVAGAWRLP